MGKLDKVELKVCPPPMQLEEPSGAVESWQEVAVKSALVGIAGYLV